MQPFHKVDFIVYAMKWILDSGILRKNEIVFFNPHIEGTYFPYSFSIEYGELRFLMDVGFKVDLKQFKTWTRYLKQCNYSKAIDGD